MKYPVVYIYNIVQLSIVIYIYSFEFNTCDVPNVSAKQGNTHGDDHPKHKHSWDAEQCFVLSIECQLFLSATLFFKPQ